jgi:hypothetical protein
VFWVILKYLRIISSLISLSVTGVEPIDKVRSLNVTDINRTLALEIVNGINQKTFESLIKTLKQSGSPILLRDILPQITNGSTTFKRGNKNDRYAIEKLDFESWEKGNIIPESWLYTPEHYYSPITINNTLIAYAPSGDQKDWSHIPALTMAGEKVSLDVYNLPNQPIIVVDSNGYHSFNRKIVEFNKALVSRGLQKSKTISNSLSYSENSSYVHTTKLNKISLNDDKEPWIKGAAEIFVIINGLLDDNEPEVKVIPLPYLDHDGKDYYPNQVLINWSEYHYIAVDIHYYEDDENHNYLDLAVQLTNAAGAIGSMAGWEPATALAEITTAILEAMPSNWWSDNDDYVDSHYTIEKNRSYYGYYGAGANAKVTLTPYYLYEN